MMPNFCVDCVNYWQADEDDSRFRWSIEKTRCLYYPEDGYYDLVTGEHTNPSDYKNESIGVLCYDFRFITIMIAGQTLSCGREGKFFQKKVDAPES